MNSKTLVTVLLVALSLVALAKLAEPPAEVALPIERFHEIYVGDMSGSTAGWPQAGREFYRELIGEPGTCTVTFDFYNVQRPYAEPLRLELVGLQPVPTGLADPDDIRDASTLNTRTKATNATNLERFWAALDSTMLRAPKPGHDLSFIEEQLLAITRSVGGRQFQGCRTAVVIESDLLHDPTTTLHDARPVSPAVLQALISATPNVALCAYEENDATKSFTGERLASRNDIVPYFRSIENP